LKKKMTTVANRLANLVRDRITLPFSARSSDSGVELCDESRSCSLEKHAAVSSDDDTKDSTDGGRGEVDKESEVKDPGLLGQLVTFSPWAW
jgi:hypothetical protein